MILKNIDIEYILQISKSKKIVCFGAGLKLTEFCNKFASYEFDKIISYIVDNNPLKKDTYFQFRDTQIYVNGVEQLLKECEDTVLVIVTCADIESVIEQLSSMTQLKRTECCLANLIMYLNDEKAEKNRVIPESFKISSNSLIPKTIHYCWFGGNPIPPKYKEWMTSWNKYCPDYEIIEWNEKNYNITQNKFIYEAYQNQQWSFVSDYARLDIIYNYGGIYLDTDVEIIKSLDDLLYQPAFFGVESTHLINTGLGFGAIAGHDLLGELLEFYCNRTFDINNLIPCPKAEKDIYKRHGFVENGEYQILNNGTVVYPEKVLSAKNNMVGIISPLCYSYSIHHYDGSWVKKDKIDHIHNLHKLYTQLEKGDLLI